MATSTVSVYDQFDFLPDVTYDAIVASGNILQPIFEWLQVPQALAEAVMGEVGGGLGDHVSCIAHITPDEWEGIIGVHQIRGHPVNLIARAKLRQVLLSARIVVGVVRAPPAPATPQAMTMQAPPTLSAPDSSDAMLTVNVNDVIAQGVEPIRVPLMTDEEYQETIENYKVKEGKYPGDDEKPTIEQASAFRAWVQKKRRIYLDMRSAFPTGSAR